MLKAIADTHAIIWRVYSDTRLSANAKTFLDSVELQGGEIGISTISLVEIVYLSEKGRIPVDTFTRVTDLLDVPNTSLIEIPFSRPITDVMRSIDRFKISDLHDRMIAATAVYRNVPLISRDAKIQVSGITTIW